MASGKKNYFRHHNDAFSDPKIQKAVELLGYSGYAYYFILLELFSKHCEDGVKNPITIHQQTVRILLRKSQQSCNKVVTKLQESGLLYVTITKSFYEFSIPNLAKYMGSYSAKFPPNAPNEIKGNEIKLNKIKRNEIEKETAPSPPIVLHDVNIESFHIPDSVTQSIAMTEGYPAKIISEVAKEAWLIYNANDDKQKNWTRFLSYYFRNEKQKIRDRILNDDDLATERLIKKYEGSEYEF